MKNYKKFIVENKIEESMGGTGLVFAGLSMLVLTDLYMKIKSVAKKHEYKKEITVAVRDIQKVSKKFDRKTKKVSEVFLDEGVADLGKNMKKWMLSKLKEIQKTIAKTDNKEAIANSIGYIVAFAVMAGMSSISKTYNASNASSAENSAVISRNVSDLIKKIS